MRFLWLWLCAVSALRCINFYGLETEGEKLVCSWVHPPEWYLDTLQREMQIDSIRLPFSYQLVSTDQGMAKLRNAVTLMTDRNLSVILDYHRTFNTHQSPGPDKEVTLEKFVCAWYEILAAFEPNPRVIGLSVFNEIQSSDKAYAVQVQTDVVLQLEKRFPRRFQYFVGGVDWGKDVGGMRFPQLEAAGVNFSVEIHEYPFFAETEAQITARYDTNYRVFVGELGFEESQIPYMKKVVAILNCKGVKDVCFWTIAHSKGTGGVFKDDCKSLISEKVKLFNSIFDNSMPSCSLRGSFP